MNRSIACRYRFLVLERSVELDLKTVDRVYQDLGAPGLENPAPERTIVVAYHLQRIYTAFETIFREISANFESCEEAWRPGHQVLRRMCLDLTPIRPAVIDAEAYEKLDELRRFRHAFHTMYGMTLDPERLRIILQKALDLKELYRPQIERFLEFLRGME